MIGAKELRPDGTAPGSAVDSFAQDPVSPYGTGGGPSAGWAGGLPPHGNVAHDDGSGMVDVFVPPPAAPVVAEEEAECPCLCWCFILWPFSGIPIPIPLPTFTVAQADAAAELRPADSATLDSLLSPQDVTSNDPLVLVRNGARTAMQWYEGALDLAVAAGLAPAITDVLSRVQQHTAARTVARREHADPAGGALGKEHEGPAPTLSLRTPRPFPGGDMGPPGADRDLHGSLPRRPPGPVSAEGIE